jgi:hypothetical protein
MRENVDSVSNLEKLSVTRTKSKTYEAEKIERSRVALISIIDFIITLDKRNIAFRGNWNKELLEEDGNFMCFVNWKAKFDETLKYFERKSVRQISIP